MIDIKYNGVAFCGEIGSGKSTVAQALAEDIDQFIMRTPVVRGFATDLKERVAVGYEAAFPTLFKADKIYEEMMDPERKMRWRLILQGTGTDLIRDTVSPGFWVSQLCLWILNHKNQFVIVDDLRFPNEAEELVNLGFLIVRCEANPERDKYATEGARAHASENQLVEAHHLLGWAPVAHRVNAVYEMLTK